MIYFLLVFDMSATKLFFVEKFDVKLKKKIPITLLLIEGVLSIENFLIVNFNRQNQSLIYL